MLHYLHQETGGGGQMSDRSGQVSETQDAQMMMCHVGERHQKGASAFHRFARETGAGGKEFPTNAPKNKHLCLSTRRTQTHLNKAVRCEEFPETHPHGNNGHRRARRSSLLQPPTATGDHLHDDDGSQYLPSPRRRENTPVDAKGN